jgi:hypothetical protein
MHCKNKNVDIKFSAHDAFLEKQSSSDAHNRKIGKPNNLKLVTLFFFYCISIQLAKVFKYYGIKETKLKRLSMPLSCLSLGCLLSDEDSPVKCLRLSFLIYVYSAKVCK